MSSTSKFDSWGGPPPDHETMVRLAEAALERLPARFLEQVKGVAIRIEELPDEQTCREMELESPFDLLGLYHGIPFGEADGGAVPTQPDLIFLYRLPILDYWCQSGERLDHVVAHVLIHEIGHHFGFSDADMEWIETRPLTPN